MHMNDHWSTNTKQDTLFTVFSFETVFESIKKKPNVLFLITDPTIIILN